MSGKITVVIPYFNEAGFLEQTLASLASQTLRPFSLILVDNGSDDDSPAIAARFARPGIAVRHLTEPTPGQVHALSRGIAAVTTDLVAICDADTIYPPHYLARAVSLLDGSPAEIAGVIAHNAGAFPYSRRARLHRFLYTKLIPRLLPMQAHGGGYAHVLKTAALREAGGYSADLWPHVLKDHELAHRLMKRGRLLYDEALWCRPSARRTDRRHVRWTLFERIMYHATPPVAKDWFWYHFLRRRFERRGLSDTALRVRPWHDGPR